MSESKETHSTKLSRGTVAILGLIVAFVLALAVNFLFGKFNLRADLTEYNVYTLSEGTRNILNKLDPTL